MKTRYQVFALVAALSLTAPLNAEVELDAKADGIQKEQVTQSMIGFRDTIAFYTFAKEKAVLVVSIGNKDTSFPVSAKLYVFPEGTDAEGLAKWINNQHSDGLFIDAAEPEAVQEIPAASCTAEKHVLLKQVEAHNGQFSSYSVTFRIKDVPALGDFKLKDFTDQATVFVKAEGA